MGKSGGCTAKHGIKIPQLTPKDKSICGVRGKKRGTGRVMEETQASQSSKVETLL